MLVQRVFVLFLASAQHDFVLINQFVVTIWHRLFDDNVRLAHSLELGLCHLKDILPEMLHALHGRALHLVVQ